MSKKGTYVVERERRIPAPASEILARIVDFQRWPEWSPWEDLDPNVRRSYTGSDSGVGAVYEWQGNRKAGVGRMEITSVERRDDSSEVTIDLQFLKPFKSRNTTTFRLRRDGDATQVTWTMQGPQSFMTRVVGIFKSMDKMIGPDFEKGLRRIEAATGTA